LQNFGKMLKSFLGIFFSRRWRGLLYFLWFFDRNAVKSSWCLARLQTV